MGELRWCAAVCATCQLFTYMWEILGSRVVKDIHLIRFKRELQALGHAHTHGPLRTHPRPANTHSAGLQTSHEKLLAAQKQLKTRLLLSSVMDGAEVC